MAPPPPGVHVARNETLPPTLVERSAPRTGARALLAAVLDRALEDWRHVQQGTRGTGGLYVTHAVAADLEAWFRGDVDAHRGFTFEAVCAAVGLDVDAVRARVLGGPVRRVRARGNGDRWAAAHRVSRRQ